MPSIHIYTVGKLSGALFELVEEYEKRLRSSYQVEWHAVKTGTKDRENISLKKLLSDKRFVVLDEHGKSIRSTDITEYMRQMKNAGHSSMHFVIGGSYGLSSEIINQAHQVWSFGHITLPHQLAKLILIEQLYRADSIERGLQYHHD